MKKYLILLTLLILVRGSKAQTIPIKWAKNMWAKKITAGMPPALFCKNGDFYASLIIHDSILLNNKYHTVDSGSKWFLIRLNANGELIWEYSIEAPAKAPFSSPHLFIGEDESVYATFDFYNKLQLGTDTTLYSQFQNHNSCICKFNANGSLGWVQQFFNPNLIIGNSALGGVVTMGNNKQLRYNNKVYPLSAALYFNSTGNLTDEQDSLCYTTRPVNISMGIDSNYYIKTHCLGNYFVVFGGDTIRNPNSTSSSIHSCVSRQNGRLIWHHQTLNSRRQFSIQYNQLVIDKFGNSYFVNYHADSNIFIDGKTYRFPDSDVFAFLYNYDKNGQLKNLIFDSLPQGSDTQYMKLGLSEDSTKLLLYIKFKLGYTLKGVTKFENGEAVLLVLDIMNNLNCIKYYKIFDRFSMSYSPNPFHFGVYATTYNMALAGISMQIDTFNFKNTSSENLLVAYFDEQALVGYNRVDENSFVSVFPNPCQNKLNISGTNIKNIEIMDMLGRTLDVSYTENKEELDMSPLKAGVYFIRINNSRTFKVVKQ